jgi:hypothetical protein
LRPEGEGGFCGKSQQPVGSGDACPSLGLERVLRHLIARKMEPAIAKDS